MELGDIGGGEHGAAGGDVFVKAGGTARAGRFAEAVREDDDVE